MGAKMPCTASTSCFTSIFGSCFTTGSTSTFGFAAPSSLSETSKTKASGVFQSAALASWWRKPLRAHKSKEKFYKRTTVCTLFKLQV